ncbi:hypothetical protein C8F01DRAFT_479472 [Mycena amicta]|nr:hypothetical protein C8F01DRAFT_479472 [Mycena amicta]
MPPTSSSSTPAAAPAPMALNLKSSLSPPRTTAVNMNSASPNPSKNSKQVRFLLAPAGLEPSTSRTRTINDSGDAGADTDSEHGGYSSSEIFASIVPVESPNNILAGWNPPSNLDPSILDQSKFRRARTVTTSPPTRPSTPLPLAWEGLYPYAPHTIPRAARENGLLALSMTRNTNGLGDASATASDDSEDEDDETSSFLSRLSMLAVDGESLRSSASPSPTPVRHPDSTHPNRSSTTSRRTTITPTPPYHYHRHPSPGSPPAFRTTANSDTGSSAPSANGTPHCTPSPRPTPCSNTFRTCAQRSCICSPRTPDSRRRTVN